MIIINVNISFNFEFLTSAYPPNSFSMYLINKYFLIATKAKILDKRSSQKKNIIFIIKSD